MKKKLYNLNSSKVVIAFNRPEENLITDLVMKHKPAKFYYFTAYIRKTNQSDIFMSFYKRNVAFLRKQLSGLEIITQKIDYTNEIECSLAITKIILKESNNSTFYINLGTTTPMLAIGVYMASLVNKNTKIKTPYIYSEVFEPNKKEKWHKGHLINEKKNLFEFEFVSTGLIRALKAINEILNEHPNNIVNIRDKYLYKTQIVDGFTSRGLLPLNSRNPDKKKELSSLLGKLEYKFLKKLEEFGFIFITGKRKRVYISNKGKTALHILGPQLNYQ